MYFAADNWLEYSDRPISVRQYRKVTGVFLYQKDGTCFYGTADIVQPFDPMNNVFADSAVTIGKPILTACRVTPAVTPPYLSAPNSISNGVMPPRSCVVVRTSA